jgi:DNA-directed RNA polymerase subunit M/transcription elongation factor TFIIS
MTTFCPICRNLLFINTQSDELKFECRSCKTSIPGSAEDSMRFEEIEGSDITVYGKLLQKIAEDPVGHKTRKQCPKCGNEIARDVIIGDDMRTIYVCMKPNCRYQWVSMQGDLASVEEHKK